jgi:hypothetical protein
LWCEAARHLCCCDAHQSQAVNACSGVLCMPVVVPGTCGMVMRAAAALLQSA